MSIIIGVDTGLHGYIAAVDAGNNKILETNSMPIALTTTPPVKRRDGFYKNGNKKWKTIKPANTKRYLDIQGLFELISKLDKEYDVSSCIIEDQFHNTRGRMGQKGLKTIYANFGATKASCICSLGSSRVHLIQPKKWKKELGLTKNKQDSIDLVEEIFGIVCLTDDEAEAILIAHHHIKSKNNPELLT